MIFTSYYGNWRKFPAGFTLVSISQACPPGVACLKAPLLAPSKSLLADYKGGKVDEGEYEDRYLSELGMKRDYLAGVLTAMKGKDVILLCYEKSSDFCHRHLFRKYVEQTFPEIGIQIEEL